MTCEDARKMLYAKIRFEMDGKKDFEQISRYLYQCELMFGKNYYIDPKFRYIEFTKQELELYNFLEETVIDKEGEFAYAYYFHPDFDYALYEGTYYILNTSFYEKAKKKLRNGKDY